MASRMGPKEARRRMNASEKQAKCIDLYQQGFTYRAIAKEVGYASIASVKEAIDEAIKKVPSRSVDELRTEVGERSRLLLEQLMPIITNPRSSRSDKLEAIDRVIKVDKEIRKLHGLDAPTTINFDVSGLTDEQLSAITGIVAGEPDADAAGGDPEEVGSGAPAPDGGADAPPLEDAAGAGEGADPGGDVGSDGSALA